MMSDLAALTPPLVMCVAFLVGVGLFLRHQLAPKRRAIRRAGEQDHGERDHSSPAQSEFDHAVRVDTRSGQDSPRGPANPTRPAMPDNPAKPAGRGNGEA